MKINNKAMVAMSVLGAAGLISPGLSTAQSFQDEVSYQNMSIENDSGTSSMDINAIFVSHFFDSLSTNSGPLAEAAFLGRVSDIHAGYGDVAFTVLSNDLDGSVWELGANYFVPGSDYFFAVDIRSMEVSLAALEATFDTRVISGGMYLDDQFTIELEYSTEVAGTSISPDTDYVDITVRAKRLLDMGGQTVNVEGSVSSSEADNSTISATNTIMAFSGDYYVNDMFSVGLGFSSNSGDDLSDEGLTTAFSARYFFTPTVSLALNMEQFSADNAGNEDEDTLEIELMARF